MSRCTRDDQLVSNVDEFMRDDLNLINKEEDKLQRELRKMNQNNLAKHAKIIKQNRINTQIQNTEQLVRKMMHLDPKNQAQKTPLNVKKEPSPKPGVH